MNLVKQISKEETVKIISYPQKIYTWHKTDIMKTTRKQAAFPNIMYCSDTPFPVVCSRHLCQKSIDCKYVDLFLVSLFCSIDLHVIFLPILNTLAIQNILKSGNVILHIFFVFVVVFAWDLFGYLGSIMVPYEFHNFFFISVKNALGILIGIALNLQIYSMNVWTIFF